MPDWLFSAVVHLLLVGLLITSKAGPGGGGNGTFGSGEGGGGPGDFPGDGWIEAQIGDEALSAGPAQVSLEPIDAPTSDEAAKQPHDAVVQAVNIESDARDVADQLLPAGFVPAWTPASAASGLPEQASPGVAAASAQSRDASSGKSGGGDPGSGHGRGDGSAGMGGHGQGGTSLFGIWDSGERIVYAIDRSSSMQHYEKLNAARQELEASIAQLDESFEFQVLYYNQHVQPLNLPGTRGLIRASSFNKNRIRSQIRLITAEGGTQHRAALQAALDLNPTVLYFLSDAESEGLTPAEIAKLGQLLHGRTRIHCIQFVARPGEIADAEHWLARLAYATGGRFVHVRTGPLQRAEAEPGIRR